MQQFAPLIRKDNQAVRYLVVDDSVFARKNLIKMIEIFGGGSGRRSRRWSHPPSLNSTGTKPDIVPHGHYDAPDGRH